MDKKINLLEGTIWTQILFFFFPILIGTFFQQLYNTVDTIIVGQYVGTNALAAVGSTGNLTALVTTFFVGLASGSSVVIAQYFGADDEKRVGIAVHTSYALGIVSGFIFTVFGLLCSYSCLKLIGVPGDILNDSTVYMQIYFLNMIPGAIYNIGAGILRAIGDSKTPLYHLIIACIVNIVLDVVFVVYMDMGIIGAAIATDVAQVISAVLVTVKLMRTHGCYHLNWRDIRFNMPILEHIIRIGMPAGIQSTLYSISNLVLQSYINAFGTTIIAAWAVYTKIDALFWMIMTAFGAAITTFVGQNYGAGRYDRVQKGARSSLVMTLVSAGIVSGFLFVFGNSISSLFSSDMNIIRECGKMISFLTPFYFTYCCVEVYSGTIRGCGESLKPMIIVCLGVCVLRIIWVMSVTPFFHTFNWVIVSYPITWTTTSLLFIFYYHSFKKKHF